ncbi:MAG: SEC-C metal-binding domain-containing protein [Syntrophomonadaceae bacterium]
MKRAKIGRNDPCPCGSGKKFKNCCLVLESMSPAGAAPFDRYNTLMASLKMKLDQNYEAPIRKVRKPMQERFLRLSCDRALPREQESVFSDWLWFDMTDSEGMTFGREYISEHGDYMEEPLRECLEALNDSFLSVYSIESSQGETLRLRDFFTGAAREVMLKEPLELDTEQAPPLLLGRLASMPGGTVFSGMILMLGDDKGQGDFIRRHAEYWHDIRPDVSIPDLCKQYGEVLFGLFDHASHKSTLALNDIRYLPGGNQAAQLSALISRTNAIIPVHNTSGTAWYEFKESLGPARVGVSDRGHLVFYADVVDDILKAEEMLDFKNNGWQIVNSLLLFTPPPQELGDIWYEVIRERETERWLHTVHQELDNKTPAQVLAEAGGKERLLQLLDAFAESAAENQLSLDLVNYMRARVA